MSDNTTFTEEDVITGMCLWETFLELGTNSEDDGGAEELDDGEAELKQRADEMLSDEGSFTMRNALMKLIAPCNAGWKEQTEQNPDGDMQFDWDWCPKFIRQAMQDGSLDAAIAAEYSAD